jgi:hypothetical protein
MQSLVCREPAEVAAFAVPGNHRRKQEQRRKMLVATAAKRGSVDPSYGALVEEAAKLP